MLIEYEPVAASKIMKFGFGSQAAQSIPAWYLSSASKHYFCSLKKINFYTRELFL